MRDTTPFFYRKYIRFRDGTKHELSMVSYSEFSNFLFKMGASDIVYNQYLRDKNWSKVDQFNQDALLLSELVIQSYNRDGQFISEEIGEMEIDYSDFISSKLTREEFNKRLVKAREEKNEYTSKNRR